jgi:dipeptidyl-peptidase-3
VLARYKKLNIAPYSGFMNPVLKPVTQGGQIVDVKIEYPADFMEQMLYYAREYSFLPTYN